MHVDRDGRCLPVGLEVVMRETAAGSATGSDGFGAVRGQARSRMHETIDAAWFDPAEVAGLVVEPGADRWITWALSGVLEPHLD
jgi:hypothetical protein